MNRRLILIAWILHVRDAVSARKPHLNIKMVFPDMGISITKIIDCDYISMMNRNIDILRYDKAKC